MRQLVTILWILTIIACQAEKRTDQTDLISNSLQTEPTPDSTCSRCIIDSTLFTTEKWKKITYSEMNSFLCAWDESCDWPDYYLEFKNGQFYGAAWDMLFFLFNEHFEDYNDVLNNNRSLNLDYLIRLYSKPGSYDLPHDLILMKLKRKSDKTTIDSRLIKAFENAIKENDSGTD